MRVLITGSMGNIGRSVTKAVHEAGYQVRTFDRPAQRNGEDRDHIPGDVRDPSHVRRAMRDVDAIVHLAAIANDRYGNPEDVFTTNVLGTWNVLLAASEVGVERLVFFSSVNSLGNFQGQRTTLYFPVDDEYPRHPVSPYQLSKHLGEEMCRSFTERTGMTTIALRPMFVSHPDYYGRWTEPTPMNLMRESRAKGDYWSYVDMRDVVDATLRSLTVEGVAHDAYLLAARDTVLNTPTSELIDRNYPDVLWRVDRQVWLAGNPYRSLVDCTHAREVLGWEPKHSWRDGPPGAGA